MPPLKRKAIMSSSNNNNNTVVPSIKTVQEESQLANDAPNAPTSTATATGKRMHRRIRRSRSAPPVYNRKNNNRSLVNQHFEIDKENHVLLPGVPVHDDDFARDLHDFFNLIVLVPIVVLNFLNWDWNWNWDTFTTTLTSFISSCISGSGNNNINNHNGHGNTLKNVENIPFVNAWTGEYFQYFFWTTVAYFLVDMIWVSVIPRCVKSPSTIITHHIAVFVYLSIPYLYPQCRFLMGVCMSVELNTWFLIARRVFNKQGTPPWKFDIPYLISVRVKLISIFFYTTWISIRCIVYPYVLYVLAFKLLPHKDYADIKYTLIAAILLQSVFCWLNAKWSFQLLNSKLRQWKKNGETKVESGL